MTLAKKLACVQSNLISLNSAFIYKWLIELQEFCTKRCYTRKVILKPVVDVIKLFLEEI